MQTFSKGEGGGMEHGSKLKVNLLMLVHSVSTGFNNIVYRNMALQVLSHQESITGLVVSLITSFYNFQTKKYNIIITKLLLIIFTVYEINIYL